MPILITILLLFITALSLLLLRLFRPNFRYAWMFAVVGAFFAWLSVFYWQLDMPVMLSLPSWQPAILFTDSPFFLADPTAWAYALSLATLTLGTLLTAIVRPNFPSSATWAGILALGGVGILAVLADNPLTLVLAWTAIDLAELFTLIGAVKGEKLRERVVISFAAHIFGSAFLLWANFASAAAGSSLNFIAAPHQAGIYMIIAAGLRLGVLPMHLPFRTESALRRGFGTMLRLTSAASSLILLARIPYSSLNSPFIPYVLGLVTIAALYGSWMWFRASETLDARPYWLLGMGSLALAATLRANPIGSAAWGLALIFGGGVLFLSSEEYIWLKRLLFFNTALMATLPFTFTASGWENQTHTWGIFTPLLLAAHALLLSGYFRHAGRGGKTPLNTDNQFTRILYPTGISVFVFAQLLLGVFGWQGAAQFGAWFSGIIVTLLTAALIWLRPRIRVLNPLEAHWLKPNTEPGTNRIYDIFWSFYSFLRNLSQQITNILESDGGILWALLFLIVFASLMAGGIR